MFLKKAGAWFGQQEVIALDLARRVAFALESKGAPQRPRRAFEPEPLSRSRTRVRLTFENRIARPFYVVLRAAGMVRWTRAMHRKDPAGLKRYAGPPHSRYAGAPARELLAA